MKNTFLILIFYLMTLSSSIAQAKKLVPSKDAFESKWITNENYDMIWYAMRDTSKFEMGRVSTEIRMLKDQLLAITNVKLKNMNIPWVDSTSAELKTLKPIRHTSYNRQRPYVMETRNKHGRTHDANDKGRRIKPAKSKGKLLLHTIKGQQCVIKGHGIMQ